jgi:hypothetical protein
MVRASGSGAATSRISAGIYEDELAIAGCQLPILIER